MLRSTLSIKMTAAHGHLALLFLLSVGGIIAGSDTGTVSG